MKNELKEVIERCVEIDSKVIQKDRYSIEVTKLTIKLEYINTIKVDYNTNKSVLIDAMSQGRLNLGSINGRDSQTICNRSVTKTILHTWGKQLKPDTHKKE